MKELYLVTGPRSSGKTLWCTELASYARSRSLHVEGLISPPTFAGNEKVGITLVDLATGDNKVLADQRTFTSEGILTEDWCFRSDTLSWGNEILNTMPPCDVFILDEMGPLELQRGEGLTEGLRAIEELSFRFAFVVVRPDLLDIAQSRWPMSSVIDVMLAPSFNAIFLGHAP